MSPVEKALMDRYPDPTWDDPEELDEAFGMDVVSAEQLAMPALDEVPTMYHTEADVALMNPIYAAPASETFIISGPVSEEAKARGWRGRVMTRDEALVWTTATYGQILETIDIPYRWAYRVYKPTSAKGRYTPPLPTDTKAEEAA